MVFPNDYDGKAKATFHHMSLQAITTCLFDFHMQNDITSLYVRKRIPSLRRSGRKRVSFRSNENCDDPPPLRFTTFTRPTSTSHTHIRMTTHTHDVYHNGSHTTICYVILLGWKSDPQRPPSETEPT